MVSSFPLEYSLKNYRDVVVPIGNVHEEIISGILNGDVSMFSGIKKLSYVMNEATRSTLENPEFKKVIQEEKFDLIIFGYFITDFHFGN